MSAVTSPTRAGVMRMISARLSSVRARTFSRLMPTIAIGVNVEYSRTSSSRLPPPPTSSVRRTMAPSLLKPELTISRRSSLRGYQTSASSRNRATWCASIERYRVAGRGQTTTSATSVACARATASEVLPLSSRPAVITRRGRT